MKLNILMDLLNQLPRDVRVRNVLVGAHWTVVCSLGCGLASTILGGKPHGHEKARFVGDMIEMKAWDLAQLALSDNLLEASIGVAAINSLIQAELEPFVEINASDVLIFSSTALRWSLAQRWSTRKPCFEPSVKAPRSSKCKEYSL